MDDTRAALADPARWRLVQLLAERPRPVGVLAELAGARQPQTTKHLQTLERAGLVTSTRTGQRRVYALRPGPLRDLARALQALADDAERSAGLEQYGLAVAAERLAATEAGWADDRRFAFQRTLPAGPDRVWRALTDEGELARWWASADLRVSDLVFEARPGGRILLEYRDLEDVNGTDGVVGRAEGVVDDVRPGQRLTYRLAPLLPDGGRAFTASVDLDLRRVRAGTDLHVDWRIAGSTVPAADFIAGIELGYGQSLDRLTALLTPHPTRQRSPK